MRLTHLHIENLFSFDRLELCLDADTTVLLGPNGSGKTNALRALDLAATALRWASEERPSSGASPSVFSAAGQSLRAYSAMSHRSHSGRRQVKVGLHFDQPAEVCLIASFLRAAIIWSVGDELHRSSAYPPVEKWVDSEITPERVSCLTRGTLVAAHSGVPGGSWEVGYDFQLGPSGSCYRWVLAAPQLRNCVVGVDQNSRPPNDPGPQPRGLLQALFKFEPGSAPSQPLEPPQAVDLGEALGAGPVGPITLGRPGGTVIDRSMPAILDFLTRIGAPDPLPDRLGVFDGFGMAHVLRRLWEEEVFTVGEQLRGIGAWGASVTPVGSYDLAQLASAPTQSATALLPARLFRLANGRAEERKRFEEIQSMFGQLTGNHTFALRATPLQPQPATGGTGEAATVPERGGGLSLDILVTDDSAVGSDGPLETPIQFCGAGIWEALVLAEALSGPPGRVVVLDEPAANLHPAWQRVLRRELTREHNDQSGGTVQVLIITHAPDLVPLTVRGGASLIRISRPAGSSRAYRVPPCILSKAGKKVEAKGNERLLFVERAVLVEGEDDRAVLQILASGKKLDLEGPDRALIECGGRENIPDYIRLCQHLDIKHLVVMDGDSSKAQVDDGVRSKVEAVRGALGERGEQPFEFKEAIEQAFGFEPGQKDSSKLRQAAEKCASGDDCPPEVQCLITVLEKFER